MHDVTGIRGSKHSDDELDEVTVEVDAGICELEVAVEVDCAAATCAALCDVVLELVGAAPLFVPRYMTRPIITATAMTIAAMTATATPARDSSIFIPMTI